MKELIISLMVLCIIGYLISSILENKSVRVCLAEIWVLSESHKKLNHKKTIFKLMHLFMQSVYCKKGEFSFLKLLTVSLISNFFTVIYFTQTSYGNIFVKASINSEISNSNFFSLLIIITVFIFSVIFVEYMSYIITDIFLELGRKNNSYKFIAIDIFLLIFLFIIPYAIIMNNTNISSFIDGFMRLIELINKTICGSSNFDSSYQYDMYICYGYPDWFNISLMYLTPMISSIFLFIEFESGNFSNFILLIFPTFSICLPSIIYLSCIAFLYNKRVLKLISIAAEKLEQISYFKMKSFFIIIYTFLAGLLGIYL